MNPKVLVIGFVPKAKEKETKTTLRNRQYAEETLAKYDLGETIVCNDPEFRELLPTHDPIIVLVTSETTAQEVKTIKPDSLVYVIQAPSSVFYRKENVEENLAEQDKKFSEAERMVKHYRESSEEERVHFRKFAAMSYNDMYKMIQQAIIGENEELRKSAWDLLMNNDGHSNFVWMRVQLMAEVWEHSKGKQLEELMLMSMERHIDQNTAYKMDNFTDEDGLEYHQYMFLDPFGCDTNHIRRLPFAIKNQDRYAYEALLEKNEIPTNYLRIQVEANAVRKQWDDYLASECVKVKKVLEDWKKDPSKSKKELHVVPWNSEDSNEEPLTERELDSMKNFLKKHDLPAYESVFN